MNRITWRQICSACLAALLLTATANADPITGSGTWQDFPATLNSDGSPYFDAPSYDGSNANIAYFLSGYSGAYDGSSPGVTPRWYGNATGQAVTNFYFNASQSPLTATLLLENSASSLLNEFGWYDTSAPTVHHVIFAGSDSVGAVTQFTPSTQYGYYLISVLPETYYTQSSLNPSVETSHQHFAVFQQSAGDPTWVGVEDLRLTATGIELSGDYNDMAIQITGVPEPGTGFLAGAVLLALGLGLRFLQSRRGARIGNLR
ncbi:MAG: hypothetical protein LLG20_11945 [Acidobacteriales bacterium]|nr:hypothetical protein [Terriglobales bacterium]